MIKKMTTFVLAMMAAQTLSASPGASTRHRRNIVAQVQEKVRKRECNSSFACASPPALVASAEKVLALASGKAERQVMGVLGFKTLRLNIGDYIPEV